MLVDRTTEATIPSPHDRSAPTTEPQRILLRLLESAFGEDSTGPMFVAHALREARREALPTGADALLDFVRAHLMAPLAEELGPRMAAAIVEDLGNELARVRVPTPTVQETVKVHSSVPASEIGLAATEPPRSSGVRVRASVLLCDGDRFHRASLARALVSASFDVSSADTPLDVISIGASIDVAILDMQLAEVAAVLGAIMSKQPNVRVIAVTNDPPSAETLIRAASVRNYRIVPKGMRPQELGTLIKRLAVA